MSLACERNPQPLPGYRLIEPLGSGGFGEVYKCEAPGGLYKAIKFVFGNLNSLDGDGARAEQEFHALNRVKQVRHPFVLSVDRIDVVHGEVLIVMELADKSLHDLYVECQAAGLVGIPRDNLLRYLRDAAEALDHMLDKHNLQHLDIKPRNLFLISDRVKVADFGLVKHLSANSAGLVGATPLYGAPETFQGKISEHSDQYSLAIVYHELLTGQRPFSGKNARQLAMQHMQEEPELRALPEAERPVVARALAKDPAKRFPNCLSFLRALYTAYTPLRPAPKAFEAVGSAQRPKTMAETMEDIPLELMAEEPERAPPAQGAEELSQLGLTIHQPDTGVLRPTLILGLGGFGRRALMELRCRFLDRFGELNKVPLNHFLYIDPDQESARAALRGATDVAYTASEVYHLPLQPMANYRRRMLDYLNEWLPREKLYSMPRSLQTHGSRALGRLAFVDNHLRLQARLRRAVEQVTHPDSLFQTVTETGLALRNNRPRIYVIVAAGGGSSGMLVDLGYSLRRLLQQMHHPEAEVTAFVFCGAPDDPATPGSEQANLYATLTELNHFTGPDVRFAAQYGADGPALCDAGPPFHSVYLLKLNHRNPEALRDAVAHLGSYLFHELTTPLGLRLDRDRQATSEADGSLFRSFGTYAVWFPRGLLLRLAAQQACIRLVQDWQAGGEPTAKPEVDAACARLLADPGLRFEALCAAIEKSAAATLEGDLAASLTGLLAQLEEQAQQSVAQNDPGPWSQQALGRVQEWLGPGSGPGQDSAWRKGRIGAALNTGLQKVATDWEKQALTAASALIEHPGRRMAAAEACLTRLAQYCGEAASLQRAPLQQQLARTQQAADQVEQALNQCRTTGGFSFFGSRARRLLRVFVDHLAAFSRQRLATELLVAGVQFFATLQNRLEDRLRDLSFCRQRLRHLQESLEAPPAQKAEDANGYRVATDMTPIHSPLPSTEAYWDAIRQTATARLVLPDGEVDLERAARHFVRRLSAEQWTLLDQALQDRVLQALGGLHQLCMTTNDLGRSLSPPLVAQAAHCLSEFLPVTDVAAVEFSAALANDREVSTQIRSYFASAAPLAAAQDASHQTTYLLVPASDTGTAFAHEAEQVLPDAQLLRVPGQADLMFCREQGQLTTEDLQRLVRMCRPAYEEAVPVPNLSPHARCDIVDWVPLDP